MNLKQELKFYEPYNFLLAEENNVKPSSFRYHTVLNFRIIAVGYEARACGVTRQMRGDEAKEKCPDIILARVPEVRGKADLTR